MRKQTNINKIVIAAALACNTAIWACQVTKDKADCCTPEPATGENGCVEIACGGAPAKNSICDAFGVAEQEGKTVCDVSQGTYQRNVYTWTVAGDDCVLPKSGGPAGDPFVCDEATLDGEPCTMPGRGT